MIEKYSFGKIVVNGVTYTNDIKIVQGRVVSEWWRKKGHSVYLLWKNHDLYRFGDFNFIRR
jgi:hypothetical protein